MKHGKDLGEKYCLVSLIITARSAGDCYFNNNITGIRLWQKENTFKVSVHCPGRRKSMFWSTRFSNGTNSLSYTLLYRQNFGRVWSWFHCFPKAVDLNNVCQCLRAWLSCPTDPAKSKGQGLVWVHSPGFLSHLCFQCIPVGLSAKWWLSPVVNQSAVYHQFVTSCACNFT